MRWTGVELRDWRAGDQEDAADWEDRGGPDRVEGPAPAAGSDGRLEQLGAAKDAEEAGAGSTDEGP